MFILENMVGIIVESDFRNHTSDVLLQNGSEEVALKVSKVGNFGDSIHFSEDDIIEEVETVEEELPVEQPYWSR